MRFTGNGITNCYPDEVEDFISITVLSDAPRHLRVKAVDKLPDLIEALVKATDATASRLKKQVAPAQELAAAVNELINPKDK